MSSVDVPMKTSATNDNVVYKSRPLILPEDLLAHLDKYSQLVASADEISEYW